MESKTCEINEKVKLEVEFPKDLEDYHTFKQAINIIQNKTGASIKIVLQMEGNPIQVEETRELISKMKFSNKLQPLKQIEFDIGLREIKNYFLSKLNEFKIICQDEMKDIKNYLVKLSENSIFDQKLESDIMSMINRFLEETMKVQESEIKTHNRQFETLLSAINSNSQELLRLKENFEKNQKEDDQNDTLDLDAFCKSKKYIECHKNNGAQPLHIASKLGRLDVVKKLISKGANINMKDEDGWTPLYYASGSGRLHVLRYLVSQKARIDEQNICGFTALSKAVVCGRKDVVQFLCSKNAALDIRDQNNRTPLDTAYLRRDHKMIEILKKYTQKNDLNQNFLNLFNK